MSGQPKAPFYVAVLLVVAGLVGLAVYRMDLFAPQGDDAGGGGKGGAPIAPQLEMASAVEDTDLSGITTVQEYEFVSAERLTPVAGDSDYAALGEGPERTVKFALNVWAGWAPIILANEGGAAGKVWKDANGQDFKVELQLIDNPSDMITAYASGGVHIGWGTLDMVPLFLERLRANGRIDSRSMPRVIQQVDWSNGGDGIVVRESIKTVKDLKGKKIVLAQNSPSHYFILNMLVAAGIQPHRGDVEFVFTGDAFQAARAFATQPDIDACVSWAPDIYNLEKIQGNHILVDSHTANRLIADVWFARADFARDHQAILEGIVRGIFDAMEEIKTPAGQKRAAELMGKLYDLPAADAEGMLGDAESTNWGENYKFFVNQDYLANFERVWNNAYYLYRGVGIIEGEPIPFDQVMDNTIIKKLGEEERYKRQVARAPVFLPHTVSEQQAEAESFLTTTHYIHFFPNSWDLHKEITRQEDGQDTVGLYDPKVDEVLEQIGQRIEQFGLSRIVIEGHTDASKQGQVDADLVKELSEKRAEAVRDALVEKYKLDERRFTVRGFGWDRPVSQDQVANFALNRRVEVRILPAESE